MPNITIASISPSNGKEGTEVTIRIVPIETLSWQNIASASAYIADYPMEDIDMPGEDFVIRARIPTNQRELEVPGPKEVIVKLESVLGEEYASGPGIFDITDDTPGGTPKINSITPSRVAKGFRNNITLIGSHLDNVAQMRLALMGRLIVVSIVSQSPDRLVIKPLRGLQDGTYSLKGNRRNSESGGTAVSFPGIRLVVEDSN